MKVDFSKPILSMKNEPIIEEGKPITLSTICSSALLMPYEDEKNLSGDEKVKRFKLASQVYDSGEQEITIEDASLLKKLIAKAYTPLIVGRAYALLEG